MGSDGKRACCLLTISLHPRDKKQVDWVKAYLSIWTELQAYIKEYHTTGLTWSKTVSAGCACRAPRRVLRGYCSRRGACATAFPLAGLFQGPVAAEGAKAPSAPPAGAAPPPPGPPPPPAPAPTGSSTDDSASRSALFAQINRGEGITAGEWHSGQGRAATSRTLLCCGSDQAGFSDPCFAAGPEHTCFWEGGSKQKAICSEREAGSQEQP